MNKNRIILALSGLALGVLATFAAAISQTVVHDSPWDYSAPSVQAPALLSSLDVQHCLGIPSDSPWD